MYIYTHMHTHTHTRDSFPDRMLLLRWTSVVENRARARVRQRRTSRDAQSSSDITFVQRRGARCYIH